MTLEKFHEGDLFCPHFLHMGKKKHDQRPDKNQDCIQCLPKSIFHSTIQYNTHNLSCNISIQERTLCTVNFFTTLMKCCLFQQKQPLDISWHSSWRGLRHLAATCVLDTTWRPGDCSSKWHLPPTQSGGKAGGESHHGWGARGGVQWSPRLGI